MGAENGSAGHPPAVPPFLKKCFDMVEDPATDRTVSWTEAGNSFVIWDPHAFSRDLLPKYFKHGNLSSFVRQLNTYGFRKFDPDRLEFANEGFLRGQKYLLKNITRRKPTQSIVQPPPLQGKSTSVKACVELGKFGLEEEIERLRRDKNILMQELVKLRQHQQSTDHQLHTLTERLQGMEENQQQMLSFLAMAVQNPNFLSHLVQQNGNRWIPDANKKRRLPALEQGTMDGLVASNGQIIKYQPLLSEIASPCFTSVPHGDMSANLPPQFAGVNGLCTNTDLMSPGTKQSLLAEEGFLPSEFDLGVSYFDIGYDLLVQDNQMEQPENNNGEMESDLRISDFDIDYDLPVQDNQMEQVQNAALPNEQLWGPELPD